MQELPGRPSRGRRHQPNVTTEGAAVTMARPAWRHAAVTRATSSVFAPILAVLASAGAALAQQPIRITAPPLVLTEAKTEVALGIEVTPADQVPRNSFLRIRGLPPAATLSEGHVVAPGVWAVPLQSLSALRLDVPAGASGRSDVTIALVTIDAATLAEVRIALVVASTKLIAPEPAPATPPAQIAAAVAPIPASPPPSAEPPKAQPAPAPPLVVTLPPQITPTPVVPAAPSPPPPPAPSPPPPVQETRPAAPPAVTLPAPAPVAAPPTPPATVALAAPTVPQATPPAPPPSPPAPGLTPEARQRAGQLVARGNTLLGTGDIAGARLFFERAADAGLAEGALALASTYDAAELRKLKAAGIRPDDAMARRWYERARDLGSGEAVDRLKRLSYR